MKERGTQRGKENGSASEFRSKGPEGEFKNSHPSSDGAPTLLHARYTNGITGYWILLTLKRGYIAYYSPSFSKLSLKCKKSETLLHLRHIIVTSRRVNEDAIVITTLQLMWGKICALIELNFFVFERSDGIFIPRGCRDEKGKRIGRNFCIWDWGKILDTRSHLERVTSWLPKLPMYLSRYDWRLLTHNDDSLRPRQALVRDHR